MGNSPHRNEHQRRKAIRKAQNSKTEEVLPPEPKVSRIKKGLLRSDENSPQKIKRAKLRQSELLSTETDMKRKKSENNFKKSKRTTPGEVDYPTTRASAHPQRELRSPDINRKRTKTSVKRIQKKMNKRK